VTFWIDKILVSVLDPINIFIVVFVAVLVRSFFGFVWWLRIRRAQFQVPPAQLLEANMLSQQQERGSSVFASYSHKDAELVRRLLGLFRAADVPVFRDEETIIPGRKWRIEIEEALEQCQTLLLFWCGHAAKSSEVQNEYERAISLDKRVVPVLMDDTVLPTQLGQYQGVDLRLVFPGSHEVSDGLMFRPNMRQPDVASFQRPTGHNDNQEAMQYADSIIAVASRRLESSLDLILDSTS
jgi:hypothetical protein